MKHPLAAVLLPWLVLALAIGVGLAQIVATYDDFSHTWDEPAHLAVGLEWLDRGTYVFEPLTPPLSRVAVASVPYLTGKRLELTGPPARIHLDSVFAVGHDLLNRDGQYERDLTRARLGVLPLYVLACVVVFAWGWTLFGPAQATLGAAVFSALPPILAHAGVAATDIAMVLTFSLALLLWVRWLAAPSRGRALAAGAATALTMLTKHTALLYLPPCLGLVTAWSLWARRGSLGWRGRWQEPARQLGLAGVVLFAVLWGGFRFSVGTLLDVDPRLPERVESVLGPDHVVAGVAAEVVRWNVVPAPEYLRGVKDAAFLSRQGRSSYLLGEVRDQGRWEFFPIALAVKSPIPFLILVALGIVAAARRGRDAADWRQVTPLLCALGMMLIVIPSSVNLGSRHILPIFAFMSVLAGAGAVSLWRRGTGGTVGLAALLVWLGASTARVHPDYLAYFNELAALSTEPVLLDSDLDWGQDLKRLAMTLDTLPVDSMLFTYHGSGSGYRTDLPPWKPIPRTGPQRGWIAISLYKLKAGHDDDPHVFDWLDEHEPVARAGRSILIYHID